MRGLAATFAVSALVLSACGSAPPASADGLPPRVAPKPDVAGPKYVAQMPGNSPVVRDGKDWTMPAWVRPAEFSGFYSEKVSEPDKVIVRAVDVSWRQLRPTEDGPLDLTASGEAQGLFLDSLKYQLDTPGPYWVRMFSSGVDWAPQWVVDKCDVEPVGTDYDGQQHLPIWNDCVWGELSKTWEMLLKDQGLLDDPDFRFAYIPGAFTWSEYDYEMIAAAAHDGSLTADDYLTWYRKMLDFFVKLGGEHKGQLVFTGEDYPWGPWNGPENLLAAEATKAGLGIRNGITEEFNFHHSEAPSFGAQVSFDGHVIVNDSQAPHSGKTVVGTENECYVDCGFASKNPGYVVQMSNLLALQLRVNWLYVVPGPSLFDAEPENWDFVRLSIGHTPADSADAWAVLREGEDTYWRDEVGPFDVRLWKNRPWIRNMERWVTQVDLPGAVARRSYVDVHKGDPTKENGTSYEGLSTSRGNQQLAFKIDPRFLAAPMKAIVKVTYWDRAAGSFRVRFGGGQTPSVKFKGTKKWRTASFAINLTPGGTLPGGTDLRIVKSGSGGASFWMLRVVRADQP